MRPDSSPTSALVRIAGPWAASIASVALLAGVGVEVRARQRTEDGEAYHERIKSMAKMPYCVGDWLGHKSETSPYAVLLLQPNVLENWSYRNIRTGETASLLFVHCSDARDLQGHFPPACYPGQGYVSESAAPKDWNLAGIQVTGMRYVFSKKSSTESSRIVVDNFMILPTGEYGRDMQAVDDVARRPRLRRLGAAEVQIVTDGTMTDERRDDVFRTLVGRIAPLLDCVGAGANP